MDTLKRIIASITIFALMGMLAPVSVAQALTADELQAQIVALQATLLELTQQLATIQGTTTPATTFTGCAIASFTRNLAVKSTGDDVKCLQVILNSNADTKVAETGAGSPGNETTYFGAKTKAGVVKFQEKYADTILASYGLTTGTGFVGATTRAKLNELLDIVVPTTPTTPTTTTTPATTTTGLTVALASNSPIAGTVVAGQAIADLARFTFTGNNTVTSLKLKRIGVSADATLSNVYLYDGNTRLTDTATVSNGVLTFANASGLFTVNGDKTISVKSDIATGSTGQTVGVALMAATDIVPTVSGNFPVNGNTMTVATANLATVVVGTVLPSSNTTVNAGTMNYTVFSAPLTIGVRSINLSNVALKLIGSVTTDALANIKLYINGVQAGTATAINANGNVDFDLSAAPVVIQSGSATLEVRADVVKGSSRNFSFSLQNVADLVVVDSNYNVNIAATGIPATAATVGVNAGSVAVSLDPTFSVTTVTGGIANAPLAKYSFKAYGEDVKISYLDITPSRNLDNVALFANNVQIANSQNYTGTKLHFSLGSSLVVPANTTVVVEVRADTKAAGVNITSGTVVITLNGYTNNAQGVNSLSLSTVPSSDTTGSSLTVNTGGLVLAQTSGFVSQNIIANTADQKVGSFVIQAGSSEAVRITNLSVALGGTLLTSNLSNLYIKYGSTSASPINPQATNNFPVDITIQPNNSVTVDVYTSIGSLGTVVNAADTQTFVNVDTTAAEQGVAAHAHSTIELIWAAADTATVTINGFPSVFTAADDSVTNIATGLAAAINANTNVNGTVIATSAAGEVTITARTAGTAGNNITLVSTEVTVGTGTNTASSATLLGGTANTAQVDTSTPANVEVGDVFTAVINSTTFNFTATAATAANVAGGLVALINASAAVNTVVVAANVGNTLQVTALVAGTAGAFTMTSSAANGTHGATGSTVITTLGMSATGLTSNSTVASVPATLAGQTMTIAVGSLATPTLVSAPSSPVAQFVLGNTASTVATLNFVATNGTATIQELRFAISGSATTPISQITVGGVVAPVIGTTATVSGLSISVPVGYAGTNVTVTPTYNSVGLYGVTSNTTAIVTLTGVKSITGSVTTDATVSVAANAMTLVASKPSLAIGPEKALGLATGQVKLADVTVTADAAGNVKLRQLPITVNSTGAVTIPDAAVVVKDGATVIPTTGNLAVAAGGSGSVSIAITTPFNIPAGTSKVFSVYATAATVTEDDSLSTVLDASASFLWDDVNGNITGISGTQIYNYPSNTSVIANY